MALAQACRIDRGRRLDREHTPPILMRIVRQFRDRSWSPEGVAEDRGRHQDASERRQGILKVAALVGVGCGTVQRVKRGDGRASWRALRDGNGRVFDQSTGTFRASFHAYRPGSVA